MVVSNFSSSVPFFLTLFLVLTFNSGGGGGLTMANGLRTWCVAKPSATNKELQQNIDFSCNHVDCSIVNIGCPCYNPATLINHASVIMNLYYQSTKKALTDCDFQNSALIVVTDPSYGICRYL